VATVTVTPATPPSVTISANPTSLAAGGSSTLTVTATNATAVAVTGTDGSSYNLAATGGTQAVTPAGTTTYTATATGAGGNVSGTAVVTVTSVTIVANPTEMTDGGSSILTVIATNSTAVVVTGSDGSSYNLAPTGGTQKVTPTTTTTYTAEATGAAGNASATATVTVAPAGTAKAIHHVIFMLQENHSFDNYFGMLNPYRITNKWNVGDDGNVYNVDGIDDKLHTSNVNDEGVSFPLFKFKSSCIDNASSGWLESFGDVNRYNYLTSRPMRMDGFVHTTEGFAKSCVASTTGYGDSTQTAPKRVTSY
jgi:hypothetical protein